MNYRLASGISNRPIVELFIFVIDKIEILKNMHSFEKIFNIDFDME